MPKIYINLFSPSSMKRTTNLSSKLMEFNLGTDKQTFLSKLIKSIFISYLENYIEVETGYLKSRSAMILQRYYDSKNHQKRSIGTGGWVFMINKTKDIKNFIIFGQSCPILSHQNFLWRTLLIQFVYNIDQILSLEPHIKNDLT